jgi:hypothetical protein
MKKTKRWIPNRMHLAFRRSRSTVERLEDRILLSAEPLIQFNRADGEQPLVVENLAYSAAVAAKQQAQLGWLDLLAAQAQLPVAGPGTRLGRQRQPDEFEQRRQWHAAPVEHGRSIAL